MNKQIKIETLTEFWKKLRCLNDTMIESNIQTQANPNYLQAGLEKIKDCVFEIVKYYNTNSYDLEEISKDYLNLETAWNTFVSVPEKYAGKGMTPEMQKELGSKLQEVKTSNDMLIIETRKLINKINN